MVLSLLVYDYSRMMIQLSENYRDPFFPLYSFDLSPDSVTLTLGRYKTYTLIRNLVLCSRGLQQLARTDGGKGKKNLENYGDDECVIYGLVGGTIFFFSNAQR